MITVTTGGHWPDEVRRILDGLPQWFGMPESNDEYVEKAATLTNVVARDGDAVAGICLLLRHNPQAAEIDLIAVPEIVTGRGSVAASSSTSSASWLPTACACCT